MATTSTKRLGGFLMSRGLIDERQLDRALLLQKSSGLRLGSNLLEIGAVKEADLLKSLGSHRHRQTAAGAELRQVDARVRALIPRALALEHAIVPYSRRGNKLWLAATDPVSAMVEQRLSDASHLVVRTALALELRIQEALHRYYQFPLSTRAKQLVASLDRPQNPAIGDDSWEVTVVDAGPTPGIDESQQFAPAVLAKGHAGRSEERDPSRLRSALQALDDAPGTAIVEADEGVEIDVDDLTPVDGAGESYLYRIAAAPTATAVAHQLLDRLGINFARRVILRIQDQRLIGWMADGAGLVPRKVAAIAISLPSSPLLSSLTASDEPWTGAPTVDPGLREIHDALGEAPRECGLLALRSRGRAVAVLYVDSPTNRHSWQRDLSRMCRYSETAAGRLIELEDS